MQTASRAVAFPRGVDGAALLAPLNSGAWEVSPAYRRAVTELDPLLFAITYLSPLLRDQVTDGLSFSPMHLDLAQRAQRWALPRPLREGTVAPRDGGKSVWLFVVLPLWALAHGHRRFLLGFSYTRELADGHLANLLDILHGRVPGVSELLLADFPGLRPVRGAGGSTRTVLENGATIAARGMGAASNGIRSGADRPDLIIGDDLEPGEADYGPTAKAKAVSRLVQNILPMNDRAVVHVTGTTTAPNSMIHDLVKAALGQEADPWVADEGFAVRYWPAILDEGTPDERSLWPQRWELTETHLGRYRRGTRNFLLNMMNRPDLVGGEGYWTNELFRYDDRLAAQLRQVVISVDVATKTSRSSDMSAIVVLGTDAPRGTLAQRAVVLAAEAGRWQGPEVRSRVVEFARSAPALLAQNAVTVILEDNQGGDGWKSILAPLPSGARYIGYRVSAPKRVRIEHALNRYHELQVTHAARLGQLEDQQRAWTPAADRDDLLDALAGGLRLLFTGKAEG